MDGALKVSPATKGTLCFARNAERRILTVQPCV
jgi:hypothetical protein